MTGASLSRPAAVPPPATWLDFGGAPGRASEQPRRRCRAVTTAAQTRLAPSAAAAALPTPSGVPGAPATAVAATPPQLCAGSAAAAPCRRVTGCGCGCERRVWERRWWWQPRALHGAAGATRGQPTVTPPPRVYNVQNGQRGQSSEHATRRRGASVGGNAAWWLGRTLWPEPAAPAPPRRLVALVGRLRVPGRVLDALRGRSRPPEPPTAVFVPLPCGDTVVRAARVRGAEAGRRARVRPRGLALPARVVLRVAVGMAPGHCQVLRARVHVTSASATRAQAVRALRCHARCPPITATLPPPTAAAGATRSRARRQQGRCCATRQARKRALFNVWRGLAGWPRIHRNVDTLTCARIKAPPRPTRHRSLPAAGHATDCGYVPRMWGAGPRKVASR